MGEDSQPSYPAAPYAVPVSFDPIVVLEGEIRIRAPLRREPSTVISTYHIGPALARTPRCSYPEALTFKNRLTFESATSRVTIIQDRKESQLWLGGGAALELADGVYAGLSVFAANTTESSYSYSRVQAGLDPVMQVTERTSSTDVSVIGLTAIAGIQLQRGPLGIGARLHALRSGCRGRATPTRPRRWSRRPCLVQEPELEDVSVDRQLPIDAGLGVSYQATPALLLLADLNLQLGATLTTVDDPRLAEVEIELNAAPRGSLAMELEVASRKWLRAGFVVNRSAFAAPNDADDAVREDYLGGTSGRWQSGARTRARVFYRMLDQTFVEGEAAARGRCDGPAVRRPVHRVVSALGVHRVERHHELPVIWGPGPKQKTPPVRGLRSEEPPRFELGNGGFAAQSRCRGTLETERARARPLLVSERHQPTRP